MLVSNLGVKKSDSPYFSRKVVLANQLSIIIFIIALIQTGGFLAIGSPLATINWFLLLLVAAWSVPFLNFMESRMSSRYLLSAAIPLFAVVFTGHIRALHPESVHDASFYVSRYFQIAFSFLPLILFGFEERKHLFITFSINLLILLLYNQIMDAMGGGLGVAEPTINDPFFVSLSSVFALMVVSTGYFFLNKMNSEYELKIVDLLDQTEKQNKSMQDAINYAKNIQQVVLPKNNVLSSLHERLFVMYKPLHVVSGDFYMVEESERYIMFSVIDCTGHGVPGAFMSILASSSLQRAISSVGLRNPDSILNLANRLFHEDLTRSGNPDMQDGMDMVICSFDKQTNELKFAGANLFVHVVSDGEIIEYKTDKGGISMGNPERTFTPTSVTVKKGSNVYISSDGFYDQFGGTSDKKLGRPAYRELLSSLSNQPFATHHENLNHFYKQWKGDNFQVDDVCLIGFKG